MTVQATKLSPSTIAVPEPPLKMKRKWGQIEAVARRLFLDQGFHTTSMDAIAKEAMVSKATLYAYFPSKEALFAHLITEECSLQEGRLQIPSLDNGIEAALRSFSHQYIRIFIDGDKIAFFRVVSAESARFPALCRLFFENGPGNNLRRIAEFLEQAKAQGLLEFSDSCIAAMQFASLIRGELPLCTALGVRQPTEEDIAQIVESGLAVFLKAYAPTHTVS